MKKLGVILCVIAYVIGIVGCAWSEVPIDEEHFPDATFRTYVFNKFDTNCDFFLTDVEIEAAKSIEFSPQGFVADPMGIWYVTSLKGIEYLTSLESLHCPYNGLTYLDLSQNKALTKVVCDGNRLTALVFGNNPSLKYVDCWSNLLSSLSVSGCPALTHLQCSYNQLTELDVSYNSNLTYLSCSHNKLQKLDVSKNLALKECYFQDFNEYSFARFYCNKKLLQTYHDNGNYLEDGKSGGLTLYGLKFIPNAEKPGRYYINVEDYVPNITSYFLKSTSYFLSGSVMWDWFIAYYNDVGNDITIFIDKDHPWNGLVDVGEYRFPEGNWIEFDYDNVKGDVIEGCGIKVIDGDPPTEHNNEPPVPQALNMNVEVIGAENIICDIDNGTYLDKNGQPLTEESVADYSYGDSGKLGFTADGNSRLIVRVKSNRPGYALFSFSDAAGIGIERLADRSAVDGVSTVKATQISSGSYQASVVLVAPETFPSNKNFPSDKFNVNVSFIAEDEEVDIERYYGREYRRYDMYSDRYSNDIYKYYVFPLHKYIVADTKTVELKLEAAPVLLIPGMFDNAYKTFGINDNTGIYRELKSFGFNETHIHVWDDYDRSKSPNELLANINNGLFRKITDAVNQYASSGIVCTKVDIVAHGMGGLMARRFLHEAGKDSKDGNNWSMRSYKQGMVRRLITIATPHYGTPWADGPNRKSFITTMYNSVLNSPFYESHPYLEYILKPFTLMVHTIFPSPQIFQDNYISNSSAWDELKTTSPRSYGLPAGVPMHAIYGNIVQDGVYQDSWTLFSLLVDKTTGANVNVYDLPSMFMSKIKNLLNKSAKASPKFIGKAMGIVSFIYDMPSYMRLITDSMARILFNSEANDLIVSASSATAGVTSTEYVNKGFDNVDPNPFDNKRDRYSHWSICQQIDVGVDVALLLKGSLSKFTVFDSEVYETANKAQKNLSTTMASQTYQTVNMVQRSLSDTLADDIDETKKFTFAERLNLNVEPSVLNVDNPQNVKFFVTADMSLQNDVYCIFGNDNGYRFFKMPHSDKNGKNFEVEFNAEDIFMSMDKGAIEILCMSCISDDNGISGMYTSNTAYITSLTNLDSINIISLDFVGTSTIYTSVNSEILAGLYGVDSEGRYYDVSSPLNGTQWTSDEIARVNDNGCIEGLKEGSTTLTATFRGLTTSVNVEVSAALVEDNSISEDVDVEFDNLSLSSSDIRISATEGTAITAVTITATPVNSLKWSVSGNLPNGLTCNENTESFTISGTPSAGTAGTYTYTVTASNPAGSTNALITITVLPPRVPDYPKSKKINPETPSSVAEAITNMTSEQIAQIESLAIGYNITSLTGIEKMTNLQTLDLSEATSLTEVNLNGNPSVKEVNLSGNPSVTTLNLVNSKVEIVNAEGCNSLEEVHIEGNTTIKELKVSETNISSLNAKNCENLEILECSSSKISSLNLEGCMKLRTLDFAGNAMRSFNAEDFTRLETLICAGQQERVQTFGHVFNLFSFIMSAQVSGFSDADENKVLNVKCYNSSGSEISSQYNPSTGEITFSQTPAKVTYDYDTGFENIIMDVAISAESETSSELSTGSSGGGCNSSQASIFFIIMLVCAFRFAITIKKQ